MLDILHQFIHDFRWPVAVVAIVGLAVSAALYLRAFQTLASNAAADRLQQRERRRQQRPNQRSGQQQATAPMVVGDDMDDAAYEVKEDGAAAVAVDPNEQRRFHQGDLLAGFPDDSVPGSAAVDQHDHQDTETQDDHERPLVSTPEDKGPEEGTTVLRREPGSDYGIDQNARTRHDLVSPDETKRYGVNESVTTQVSRRGDKPSENIRTTAAQRAPTETIEVPNAAPAREREPANDQELLRRATRMEELGFHVGIVPERLRQDPGRVSNEEKHDLLRTLGLLEQKAKDAQLIIEPTSPESDSSQGNVNLDDILARLDDALSTAFDDDPPADNSPASAAVAEDAPTDREPPVVHNAEPAEPVVPVVPVEPVEPVEPSEASPAPAPPAREVDDDPPQAPPPASRKPKGGGSSVPDWARADTFDDDLGPDDGKQLNIFNDPKN